MIASVSAVLQWRGQSFVRIVVRDFQPDRGRMSLIFVTIRDVGTVTAQSLPASRSTVCARQDGHTYEHEGV